MLHNGGGVDIVKLLLAVCLSDNLYRPTGQPVHPLTHVVQIEDKKTGRQLRDKGAYKAGEGMRCYP